MYLAILKNDRAIIKKIPDRTEENGDVDFCCNW